MNEWDTTSIHQENRQFAAQVAFEICYFILCVGGAVTIHLFYTNPASFWALGGSQWLVLWAVIGAVGYGVAFTLSLLAPSTWGWLAPLTYGRAMTHYAEREGLTTDNTPRYCESPLANGRTITPLLMTCTLAKFKTVQNTWRAATPHLPRSSTPFLLFQQAPLRIP